MATQVPAIEHDKMETVLIPNKETVTIESNTAMDKNGSSKSSVKHESATLTTSNSTLKVSASSEPPIPTISSTPPTPSLSREFVNSPSSPQPSSSISSPKPKSSTSGGFSALFSSFKRATGSLDSPVSPSSQEQQQSGSPSSPSSNQSSTTRRAASLGITSLLGRSKLSADRPIPRSHSPETYDDSKPSATPQPLSPQSSHSNGSSSSPTEQESIEKTIRRPNLPRLALGKLRSQSAHHALPPAAPPSASSNNSSSTPQSSSIASPNPASSITSQPSPLDKSATRRSMSMRISFSDLFRTNSASSGLTSNSAPVPHSSGTTGNQDSSSAAPHSAGGHSSHRKSFSFSHRAPSNYSLASISRGSMDLLQAQIVKETNVLDKNVDIQTGNKMINHYMSIRELGRGVHGKVKLAKDTMTGEEVAIKIVEKHSKRRFGNRLAMSQRLQQQVDDASSLSSTSPATPVNPYYEKIKKEVAILKKCNHPHVVKLKEVIDDPQAEKIYLVLEYLAGGDIRWHDEESDPPKPVLSIDQARRIFRDLVCGVEYLHYQGILHRDIKPANLLWTADRQHVKISDFGVSCYIGRKRMRSRQGTDDGITSRKAQQHQRRQPANLKTQRSASISIISQKRSSSSSNVLSLGPVTSNPTTNTSTISSVEPSSSSQLNTLRRKSIHFDDESSDGLKPQQLHRQTSLKLTRANSQSSKVPRGSIDETGGDHGNHIIRHQHQKQLSTSSTMNSLYAGDDRQTLESDEYNETENETDGINDDESDIDIDNELELAKTAGSPAFFAPEVCGVTDDDEHHHSHLDSRKVLTHSPVTVGKAIDIWAMGVTLYCLVYGRVPFLADNEFELFNVIAKSPISFPANIAIDQNLRDLFLRLLDKNPLERITIEEIKHHPWVTSDLSPEQRSQWLLESDPTRQGAPLQVTEEEVTSAISVAAAKIRASIRMLSSSLSSLASSVVGGVGGLGSTMKRRTKSLSSAFFLLSGEGENGDDSQTNSSEKPVNETNVKEQQQPTEPVPQILPTLWKPLQELNTHSNPNPANTTTPVLPRDTHSRSIILVGSDDEDEDDDDDEEEEEEDEFVRAERDRAKKWALGGGIL